MIQDFKLTLSSSNVEQENYHSVLELIKCTKFLCRQSDLVCLKSGLHSEAVTECRIKKFHGNPLTEKSTESFPNLVYMVPLKAITARQICKEFKKKYLSENSDSLSSSVIFLLLAFVTIDMCVKW